MTFKLPAENWTKALAEIISTAKPGDVIHVDTDAKRELALRAMKRMGITTNFEIVVLGDDRRQDEQHQSEHEKN